jgi:predicted PurR-regulated permease PerM
VEAGAASATKTPLPLLGEEFEVRLTDLVIRIVVLGLLVHWSLELVRPFAAIFLWAAILAVALWPVHLGLTRLLGLRPKLSAALICLSLLAILIGPVAALVDNFIESSMLVAERAKTGTLAIPAPPERLGSIPVVGTPIAEAWALAATNMEEALIRYRGVLAPMGARVLGQLSAISFDLLKFMVAIVVCGLLLVNGNALVRGGRLLARRLIPPRGAQFVDLAGATVRSVSRGVVGVALLQTVLIGITLQIAGVPGAGVLAFLVMILCIVQIGPGLVVLPVIIWAWLQIDTVAATVMTVTLIVLTVMDNVLKPILMAQGLSTPMIVIFLGVLGGTIAYGLIGLFLGPIVVGVFYELLVAWVVPAPATQGDMQPDPVPKGAT